MSVYLKLASAREKFHTLELKKTGLNKFAGYQYFELGDFLIPAMKVLREFDLLPVISFTAELATMTVYNLVDETSLSITSPMGSANLKGCHEVQNIGAVETYQRRYLWVALLEIVEHDALDATTGKEGPAKAVKHAVRDGVGDELPEDIKGHLRDMAVYCVELVKDGEALKAYEFIKGEKLEADQETWLANQMDSKTRAAIKAAKPKETA